MPRRPRIKLAGIPQHIVQRGINREACFLADEDYHCYLHWLTKSEIRASGVRSRSGLAFCMSDFQWRMESKLNLRGQAQVFSYRIELMPLHLARAVFPTTIARNEPRRKLRL